MLALALPAWAAPEDALSAGVRRIYVAAVEAEADGDPRTAESGYRAVLRAEEGFLPARLGLARALVEQQQPEAALAVLGEAAFDAEAVEARGQILLSLERWEEATRAFARLARLAPESAEVLLWQAEAQAHTHPERARERLLAWTEHPQVEVIDARAARVAVLVADALRAQEEGEHDGGALLEQIAARADAEAHAQLTERVDRYEVEERARQLARGGSEPITADVRGQLDRARLAFARGEVEAAHKALAPLVRAHPRSAELLGAWATVSAARGELASSERALRAAMALEPLEASHPAALGRLLLTHYGGEHADEAVAMLDRATRLRPGAADLWVSLGDARWVEGARAGAAAAYARAEELDEAALDAAHRERLALAPEREAWPAAPELDERDLTLPLGYWIARVYAADGRRDEALAELAALREEGRAGPEIDELEAALALAAGEAERAEALYREALAARPSEPRLLVALGDVLLAQGRETEALELLSRASALPGGGAAYLPLARHSLEGWRLWQAEAHLERFFATASGGAGYAEALALREEIARLQRQVVAGSALGVGGLLLLPVGLWAARRRGISVEALLAHDPDAFRDLAPELSALRHEVLKHNTSLLEPVADALELGQERLVDWASERLYGEGGTVARFREIARRIEAIGVRHGAVLNLRRMDPLFAPALAAIDRLEAVRTDLERHRPRGAEPLRAIAHVLNRDTYAGLGVLLTRGQAVGISDELVARAWDAVCNEPAQRHRNTPPLGLDLPGELAVRGSHRDLHDILANLFRNALAAGATRVAVRAEIEEDWITGLESVVLRIADDAPGSVTTAQIRSRFIERGLGLVVDLVHRFGGSVSVVDEPGFAKAIALTLPRLEPAGDADA